MKLDKHLNDTICKSSYSQKKKDIMKEHWHIKTSKYLDWCINNSPCFSIWRFNDFHSMTSKFLIDNNKWTVSLWVSKRSKNFHWPIPWRHWVAMVHVTLSWREQSKSNLMPKYTKILFKEISKSTCQLDWNFAKIYPDH